MDHGVLSSPMPIDLNDASAITIILSIRSGFCICGIMNWPLLDWLVPLQKKFFSLEYLMVFLDSFLSRLLLN